MKIVDRYVLSGILAPALFGLGMFSMLLMASYFLKHVDDLVTKGVPASVIARFLACYIPEVLVNALPMAVLFATLTAVGQLAADAELIALHASGLSLRRILVPVALAGVLASCAAFAVDEWVIPHSRTYGRHLHQHEIVLKNPVPKVARNVFFDGGGAFKMFVREVERERGELRHVTIFQLPGHGHGWPRITEAQGARLSSQLWTFRNGTMTTARPEGTPEHFIHFREWSYPLDVHIGPPPSPSPHQGDLPLPQLWAALQQRRAAGQHTGDLEMRFWWKVAFPLASLAMALLGAPLACRTARSGAGTGVGLAVPLSIAYYLVFALCRGAAEAGKLDAVVAMWTPNAITLIAAGWLYVRASRQG